MDGLEAITPPTCIVPFRGEGIVVSPLRLEQMGPFITASRTIIARVAMVVGAVEGAGEAAVGALLLDLLEQDGGELATGLAIAVDRDSAWIAGGTLEEVADLLEAVVGLNRDFFARRLRRLLLLAKPQAAESSDSPT